MTIGGDKYAFMDDNIDNAPIAKGVYALYRENTLTYYGKAEGVNGIQGRLRAHKNGYEGQCTMASTSYMREIDNNPTARETALLEEYRRMNGKLPLCNDKIG